MINSEIILRYEKYLGLIKDVLVLPKSNTRKLKKAIRSYVPRGEIRSGSVLLLIDNTIFRSGKQGAIITSEMLFCFSNISGMFSIELEAIESISPQIRRVFGNPQLGIVLNGDYFLSLPGMTEDSPVLRDFIELENFSVTDDFSPGLVFFAVFLHKVLGCELSFEKESDPGPPPWYIQ